MDIKTKQLKRERRRAKIRAKIRGTAQRPRLVVFRSNRHTYLQAVNDDAGKIICQASDLELKTKAKKSATALANEIGKLMAKRLQEKKITGAVFDRAGYKYHGKIKAVVEGAREEGLNI